METQTQTQTLTKEQLVEQYLHAMTPLERQAYEIARSHLGTSFNIVKSNGFINRGK
jgi:transcriptional regulator CtsR